MFIESFRFDLFFWFFANHPDECFIVLIGRSVRVRWDVYDGKFQSDERKYSDILGVPRLFIPKTFVNTQRIAVDVLETYFFDPEEIVDVKVNKDVPLDHIQLVKTILNPLQIKYSALHLIAPVLCLFVASYIY